VYAAGNQSTAEATAQLTCYLGLPGPLRFWAAMPVLAQYRTDHIHLLSGTAAFRFEEPTDGRVNIPPNPREPASKTLSSAKRWGRGWRRQAKSGAPPASDRVSP
jgi:hypothetical protein